MEEMTEFEVTMGRSGSGQGKYGGRLKEKVAPSFPYKQSIHHLVPTKTSELPGPGPGENIFARRATTSAALHCLESDKWTQLTIVTTYARAFPAHLWIE